MFTKSSYIQKVISVEMDIGARCCRGLRLHAHRNESDARVNYYQLLSLTEDCSDSDIRLRYKELTESLKSLPSVDPRIKRTIKEAYKVLSNPASRAMYDANLKSSIFNSQSSGAANEITSWQFHGNADEDRVTEVDSDSDTASTASYSPGSKRNDLGRFLRNIFRSNSKSSVMDHPIPENRDIFTEVDVNLLDFISGGTVKVCVNKFDSCSDCNSANEDTGKYFAACGKCGGSGMISKSQRTPFGYISTSRSCVTCNGCGLKRIRDCTTCNNMRCIQQECIVDVPIPRGTKPGSTLRVKGGGHYVGRFPCAGDLFVKLVSAGNESEFVKDHKVYTVACLDYVDAILGVAIDVKTFCGTKHVEVPACTQHGDEVLVGNYEGIEHVIKFHISLPKHASQEEILLLNKIRDMKRQ
ncbi:chaperone [Babesia ovata]|uniref:Chaperone n=1 Tax=Babesia ovata TaxID=189622 RepID=A0A2H6KEK8_9APIC|nr:chaperone [Babesia ovata]GBE61431.1 chaperone [Babesia ovata]